MRTFRQDLVYAARAFAKTPGFTAAAVLSIAIGIAANSTVYSIVSATLYGSLPVREASRLFVLNDGNSFSWPDFVDYRAQTSGGVLEGLSGVFPLVPANAGGVGQPERVWGQAVTGNYFRIAGVQPMLGRDFLPEEDQVDGRDAVVVLGNGLWKRRFGGDRSLIGRPVMLNGRPYTVIGITPAGFTGTMKMVKSEFWAPLSMAKALVPDLAKQDLKNKRDGKWLVLYGRLQQGVTREQARAALNLVKGGIDKAYYATDRERREERIVLTPAGRMPGLDGVMGLMAIVMVLVALLLLIVCANVANLMLARAAVRRREIGVRLALGASRWRLIQQLLTESCLLALSGAGAGFGLTWVCARALSQVQLPIPFPVAFDFSPDWRVLIYTIVMALMTGVLFGLAPALRSTKLDLVAWLKSDAAGSSGSSRFGLRNMLVVVQVSLSLVLLIGAGLFLRSLQNASKIDLGMRSHGVVLMAFDPKLNGYTSERTRTLLRQLRERAAAVPGVTSVSFVDTVPLSLGGVSFDFASSSLPGNRQKSINGDVYRVSSGFFQTLGMRLLRGRDFETADGDRTAILNAKFAEQLFPNGDAIGSTITADQDTYRVIAVVENSKSRTLGEATRPCAYLSLEGAPEKAMSFFGMTMVARTSGDGSGYQAALRSEINKLDRLLAVTNMETMQEHVNKALLLPRVSALLLGTFGLVGLMLASIGLYGVLNYLVETRTREVGIRMALGADRSAMVGMMVKRGLVLVGVGTVIGLCLAAVASQAATAFLYGISVHDPVAFVVLPLVLLGVAAFAIAIPARRAALVDPLRALHYE